MLCTHIQHREPGRPFFALCLRWIRKIVPGEVGLGTATSWARPNSRNRLKQTAEKITPTANDGASIGGGPSLSRSAKKAQKKATNSGIHDEIVIHWRELETMAANITENADPKDIPSVPINILRDVLALRKKSARFFRRSVESKDGADGEDPRDKNATRSTSSTFLSECLQNSRR